LLDARTPNDRHAPSGELAAILNGEGGIEFRSEEPGSCSSEEAQDGPDAAEQFGTGLFLECAKLEECFEWPAIAPVVTELAEAIEFVLAHEALEDQTPSDRVVTDPHLEVGGEFDAYWKPFNGHEMFHWYLQCQCHGVSTL
jgi:hypothetical protein